MPKTTVTSSGSGGFGKDLLDVAGERASAVGAQGDLEAELAVRADERRGQDFAEGDALREIFREAEMQDFEGNVCCLGLPPKHVSL